jgi:serine/threonine-protein kinase
MASDRSGDRWHEIDRILERALDVPAEEREEFVRAAGGEDANLIAAVLRLLRAHERAETFLERSIQSTAAEAWPEAMASWSERSRAADGASPDSLSDRTGERIGPWVLTRLLGRGGMASVYLAERADGEFRQQAALKLLRRGLDTEDLIRRLRSERQILSSLNHPNIARLLDGGTTPDGLPYLAMAYV